MADVKINGKCLQAFPESESITDLRPVHEWLDTVWTTVGQLWF